MKNVNISDKIFPYVRPFTGATAYPFCLFFFFQIFAKESAYGQSNGKQALLKVFWSILVSNRLKNTKANELYRCNQDSRAFQIQ